MASLFIYFCSCCCWDAKAKVKDRKDNRFRGRRLKWKFPPHISIGSWQHTQCPLQEKGELYPNSIAVMSWSYMSGHGLQPFPWLLAQIGSPSLLVNTAPLPVRIGVGSIASLSPHAYHWPYPLTVSQKANVIFSSQLLPVFFLFLLGKVIVRAQLTIETFFTLSKEINYDVICTPSQIEPPLIRNTIPVETSHIKKFPFLLPTLILGSELEISKPEGHQEWSPPS